MAQQMIRVGDTLTNIIDSKTGETATYNKVLVWKDGTPMDDSKVDSTIWRKLGTEYFKRNGAPTVKWFGAKGDGVTDDYLAFQKMLDVLEYIYFPDGTYLIGSTITNTRSVSLVAVYSSASLEAKTGVDIYGESKNLSILKASTSLIASNEPMFILDGNAFGQGTLENPAAQVGNNIHTFTIDGGMVNNGFYINANWECRLNNLRIKNNKTPIKIIGALSPDAGTTNMVEIDKVNLVNGIDGIDISNSRTGTINITNSEIRGFTGNPIKGTFATFSLDSVNIAGNGNISDPLSGGVRIMNGTTSTQNRAINIKNCVFENNKWSEILIENAAGVNISGNTFHPYFTIPTLVGNEQVCIRIVGDATWGVTGVNISGNRMQPAANPPSGAEIFRFIKASGNVRNVTVSSLSAPIDSHLQYLFDISNTVEGFYTDSFPAKAGWMIPQGTVIAPFTGDNTAVYNYDAPLLSTIVRDYDQSGGINAGLVFVGSRFDSQFRYVVPWNGIYNITVGASFSGLVAANHSSVRIVLLAGARRYVIRQLDGVIPAVSRGNNTVQVKLTAGDVVYLQLQVTGNSKVVTLTEASTYLPLSFSISQL